MRSENSSAYEPTAIIARRSCPCSSEPGLWARHLSQELTTMHPIILHHIPFEVATDQLMASLHARVGSALAAETE